jgi:HTH-type transcriptional regulator / antitoxin HigA
LYSRDILIDKNNHDEFVKLCRFSDNSIRVFARQQNVTPDIVLGRLQHDGKVEYSQFSRMRYDLFR